MKFTALIREVITRDIRVIISADSKGQAKRLLTSKAAHDHKQGIVVARKVGVAPVLESVEPLTTESIARIAKDMR